jgi:hypothetical protein
VVKHVSFSGWRMRGHAAAVTGIGGERRRIWAAVNLSPTIAPHLGQSQSGHGCLAAETAGSICGCGTTPGNCRQSGSRVERRRLARKPKLRMRTKPFGSRCSRKRDKNSSSDKVISFCSLLSAESRQRKVTFWSAEETSRWLEMATRWVYRPRYHQCILRECSEGCVWPDQLLGG